ncbi:hypothetical protein [Streptomyces sp. SAI-041]|uniref:hypothetical protein n=1 Tax=Streptomyces sp. SAI-041 TaxID=2940548 RepID=UPI002473B347|nr:hypothetical protein [Streptomyces sp. SAI-041]MDH6546057.1 hypothetical protein [Streptomyces sp. SAI-041]
MTMPPPITEPDPAALICPGDKVGPCAVCQRKIHNYRSGGSPLCQRCIAPVQEKWGPGVRHTSARI